MGENNFEFRKEATKKETASTPQESDAMSRYIDLRAIAYNARMSDEERKDFAQRLIELVKILNRGEGLDHDFREDLLKQIQWIEQQHIQLLKAVDVVHRLERESRGDILVPHVYASAVDEIKKALESGVPADSLAPLRDSIMAYVRKVQSQSR